MSLPEPVFKIYIDRPKGRSVTKAIYVALDWRHRPDGAPSDTACLTAECATAEELNGEIDELISELQALKKRGARLLATP